jgi:hypothetical protein
MRGAHVTFEDFVAGFPSELCGQRVAGLPYTAWQVLEHMRIAQWEILPLAGKESTRLAPALCPSGRSLPGPLRAP